MTFASDQNDSPIKLSATSQRMLELREVVFAEWEKRVRESVKAAKELAHPILIDTLPVFYDNIAEAVTPNYSRASAVDGTSIAGEHGGERARLTRYDSPAVISEYQTLRWTIFDVLRQNNVPLEPHEILAINTSLDAGIREAMSAFFLIHTALREKVTAALTHDLRNPLAAANIAAGLILHSMDPAKMKIYAVKIIENLNRIESMTREMLDSMAFQSGERLKLDLTYFDICEMVKEVHLQITTSHGNKIEFAGARIFGWWDSNAMKRALENVVGNAVKYGDPHTPIRIKLNEVHERLLLSVHNEGNPIPPEEQECIFQIFKRTQSAKEGKNQGWGIGLPFVRMVAESHGGSIALESTLERGTTFVIDIPVDARPYQDAPTLG